MNTVSAEVQVELVVPQGAPVPLTASLRYSAADPYAVRVSFHAGLGEPVEWIFGRELLSDGLSRRSGPGDVSIWPSAATVPGRPARLLNIELSSPFGTARFQAPAGEVTAFLNRTLEIVPAGGESAFVDFAELDELLPGTP